MNDPKFTKRQRIVFLEAEVKKHAGEIAYLNQRMGELRRKITSDTHLARLEDPCSASLVEGDLNKLRAIIQRLEDYAKGKYTLTFSEAYVWKDTLDNILEHIACQRGN